MKIHINIPKGSRVKLSNGLVFTLNSVQYLRKYSTHLFRLNFENDMAIAGVRENGTTSSKLSVVEILPPEEKVDLSTLKVGDVCVTRDGQKIPWNKVVFLGEWYAGFLPDRSTCRLFAREGFISMIGYHDNDIISICRATKEERLKILKEMED